MSAFLGGLAAHFIDLTFPKRTIGASILTIAVRENAPPRAPDRDDRTKTGLFSIIAGALCVHISRNSMFMISPLIACL